MKLLEPKRSTPYRSLAEVSSEPEDTGLAAEKLRKISEAKQEKVKSNFDPARFWSKHIEPKLVEAAGEGESHADINWDLFKNSVSNRGSVPMQYFLDALKNYGKEKNFHLSMEKVGYTDVICVSFAKTTVVEKAKIKLKYVEPIVSAGRNGVLYAVYQFFF